MLELEGLRKRPILGNMLAIEFLVTPGVIWGRLKKRAGFSLKRAILFLFGEKGGLEGGNLRPGEFPKSYNFELKKLLEKF